MTLNAPPTARLPALVLSMTCVDELPVIRNSPPLRLSVWAAPFGPRRTLEAVVVLSNLIWFVGMPLETGLVLVVAAGNGQGQYDQDARGKYSAKSLRRRGLLADWIKQAHVREALILNEPTDLARVQFVLELGYAPDLNDVEIEEIGKDPFLVAAAYGLVLTELS